MSTPPATTPAPVTVVLGGSGTGTVTIGGTVRPVSAPTVQEARDQVLDYVTRYALTQGQPVPMTSTEPAGSWDLVVHPDGTVTAAPPPAGPAGTVATTADVEPPDGEAHPDQDPGDRPRAGRDAPAQETGPTTGQEEARDQAASTLATGHEHPALPDAGPLGRRLHQAAPAPAPARPTVTGDDTLPAPGDRPVPAPSATGPGAEDARALALGASLLGAQDAQAPAVHGWRGVLNRHTRLRLSPTRDERDERACVEAASRHWPGPRTVAVVNGKGGSSKTPTTILLSAVLARHGGGGVVAWDSNVTRGTLGWRTLSGGHDATVADLLADCGHLGSPEARAAEMAAYVHHQAQDRYDVLRSRPEALADAQPATADAFDAVHGILTRYYRVIVVDSGNDESAPCWRAMVAAADAVVVPTTTRAEHAESARLLLAELTRSGGHGARLARQALVVVSQASRAEPPPGPLVGTFSQVARAAVGVPYDPAMGGRPLVLGSLAPATARAWLVAAAALADGLSLPPG